LLGAVLKRLWQERRRDSAAAADALRQAREAFEAGAVVEAAAAVKQALRADPREVNAYLFRAAIAKRERRFPAAEADYRYALGLSPDSCPIRIELAAVLHQLGRFDEALQVLDDAVAIEPESVLARMNRGLMLKELARFDESERELARACATAPGDAAAQCHLASVLGDQGRDTEASAIVARVLDNDAANVDAHWTLATLDLSSGNYATGWEHYEYRLKRHDAYVRRRNLPWWRPGTETAGPLLVLAEQGLGDEIMFSSCFGDLLAQQPECLIECDARLGPLFTRSFPGARILATRDAAGRAAPEAHGAVAEIAAGSLPLYFRRRSEDFPRHQGYLCAAPERVAHWGRRLASLGPGLKVGVSWVGGSMKTRRALRSLGLAQLAPVLGSVGANFVSLQYTPCEGDIASFAGATGIAVHHWPDALADYDETAALVSALDLVISVTTSIVHLTGALGKPAWVMVPTVAEWRYARAGSSMPWYPSVRLYRQVVLGDWEPVVEAIRSDLQGLIVRTGRSDS